MQGCAVVEDINTTMLHTLRTFWWTWFFPIKKHCLKKKCHWLKVTANCCRPNWIVSRYWGPDVILFVYYIYSFWEQCWRILCFHLPTFVCYQHNSTSCARAWNEFGTWLGYNFWIFSSLKSRLKTFPLWILQGYTHCLILHLTEPQHTPVPYTNNCLFVLFFIYFLWSKLCCFSLYKMHSINRALLLLDSDVFLKPGHSH